MVNVLTILEKPLKLQMLCFCSATFRGVEILWKLVYSNAKLYQCWRRVFWGAIKHIYLVRNYFLFYCVKTELLPSYRWQIILHLKLKYVFASGYFPEPPVLIPLLSWLKNLRLLLNKRIYCKTYKEVLVKIRIERNGFDLFMVARYIAY